jgi:hypothetical protein
MITLKLQEATEKKPECFMTSLEREQSTGEVCYD